MTVLLKTLKWIFGTLFFILFLALGTLAILFALEIRVPLDPLRVPVEAAAEKALHREIGFGGEMVLVPTLWPTLEVAEVTIANPPDWGEGLLARAGTVRLQMGIVPLLSGEIQIADVTAKDVDLNLESNAQGEPNWRFTIPESTEPEPDMSQPQGDGPNIRFTSLDNLTLQNIVLNYSDKQLGKTLSFELERMQGAMREGQPMTLEIAGSLQEKPFKFDLEAGSLEQLVEKETPWPLTLTGDLAGAPLTAKGEFIRGDEPEISAALNLGSLDFGAFLAWLGVIDGLEATAEQVTARTAFRGDSLGEILATSEVEFSLHGGAWTLVHQGTGSRLNLGIEEGKISVLPQEPVSVSLDTRIDGVPFAVVITGASVADMMAPDAVLPLKLTATGGGAELTLSTEVSLPIETQKGLDFQLGIEGQRLNTMNALLKADLPPLGPYSLNGVLAFDAKGYAIRDLRLRVAETSLDGDMKLDIAKKPPYLDIDLRSKQLRIDDFLFEGWSPTKGSTEPEEAAEAAKETEEEIPNGDGAPALMSRETLTKLDSKVSVAVDNVLYGSEPLGSGSLLLTLDTGRLSLDPVQVALPGGDAEASFLFHPMESDTEIALMAKVDKFDYGVLARRIDPETEIGGKLSLDLDLKARAGSPEELLLKGEGHFDFGLWPGQLKADIFELWAVNVVSALMSEMDKEESSKVNCVIARFLLKDGVMNDRIIFADTTKMRIEGSASVDFRERTLDIQAGPKGKKPEFFSLAVPVGLSGNFDDFGIDLSALALTSKSVSFVTSPLHVPLRRIFVKGEPEDGEEACAEVWGKTDAEASAAGKEDAAASRETEAGAGDDEQQAEEGDAETEGGGLKERFRRFKEKAKEGAEESPDEKPAIDVLNLSE